MPEVRTFGRLFDDLLYQLGQGEDIAPRLRECAAAYRAVMIPPLDDGERTDLKFGPVAVPREWIEPVMDRHVIEFRADGWTIMHPLACRPNLFDCPLNRAAEQRITAPLGELGRYAIDLVDGRLILGEKVTG